MIILRHAEMFLLSIPSAFLSVVMPKPFYSASLLWLIPTCFFTFYSTPYFLPACAFLRRHSRA